MLPTYERRLIPFAYDVASVALFAVFGGIRSMRGEALDRAGVEAGTTVLELGCGTGGFTSLMVDRGAIVTAVDGSRPMLESAKNSVQGPVFQEARMEALSGSGEFKIVLAAFLMHELSREVRARVLVEGLNALSPDGKLIIVDHSVPERDWWSPLWLGLLRVLEPSSAMPVIRGGLADEIKLAGGNLEDQCSFARGTVAFYGVTRQAQMSQGRR